MSRMIKQHRVATQKRRAGGTQDFQTDRELEVSQPKTDDVRVAAKTANSHKGQFVGIFQTPKNTLELIPNHSSVAEFINDNADHLGEDILALVDPKGEKAPQGMPRHNVWGDKELLKELLHDHLGTGWHWLNPEDISQLTEAAILEAPDGRIYFHNKHQLQSAADELLQGKTVKFDGAPENRAPVVKTEVPELAPKESSVKSKKAEEDEPILPETNDDPSLPGELDAAIPPVDAAIPPAPATSGNPYQEWKSENLIETIESLTDSESFAQDKPEQKAVEQMAEILSARPVEPVMEQPKAAALKMARLATGKKAGIGPFPPADQNTGKILEGDKSLPVGREFEEDNTGVTHPTTDTPQKFAGINDPAENKETSTVLEGDKSIPEGKDEEEDNTGVDVPATDLPEKVASAPITTAKALSLVEDIQEELKALYMDAKPITTANESRPVREAVESIYHAMKSFDGAQKVLAKQKKQEEDEEATAVANAAKGKKSSFLSLANLNIAAAAPEQARAASVKDRSQFRIKVNSLKTAKLAVEATDEIADGIMRSASAYAVAVRAAAKEEDEEKKELFEKKKAHLKVKITALAAQLGLTANFEDSSTKSVMLNVGSGGGESSGGESIDVPTS